MMSSEQNLVALGGNGSGCRFRLKPTSPGSLFFFFPLHRFPHIGAVVRSPAQHASRPRLRPPSLGLGLTSGIGSSGGWTLGSCSSTCRQPHQILFPAQNTITQAEGEQLRLRNTDEGRSAGKQTLKDTVAGDVPDPPWRGNNVSEVQTRPQV